MSTPFPRLCLDDTVKLMLEQLIANRPSNRTGWTAWYSDLFNAQEEAGFSIADPAELTGISAANLYLRRRRQRAAPKPGLVRVVLPEAVGSISRASAAPVHFDLELPGSRRITIATGFDADELRRLVTTLE